MKKLFAIFSILLSSVLTLSEANAHVGNSQPFILLNGKYVLPNEIRGTIIKDMNMPGDLAPENYSIGEKIVFEIDSSKTLISSEVLGKTKFYWDFGDGHTSEGIKSSNSYEKMGTYTLKLSAGYLTNPPSVLDTVLITIIPKSWSKAPIATITVNHKNIRDPKNNQIPVKPGQSVNLEASSDSEKPATYLWDLGDGTSSTEKQLTHIYPENYTFATPVLKIENEDGFISYAYANLDFSQNPQTAKPTTNRNFILLASTALITITILAAIFKRKIRVKFK